MTKPIFLIIDIETEIYRVVNKSIAISNIDRSQPNIFIEYFDMDKAMKTIKKNIDELLLTFNCNRADYILCFGDKDNFRKKISKTYKAHRPPKPKFLELFVDYIKKEYNWASYKNLEADDTCRIIYEIESGKGIYDPIIVSIDKDFLTVPCQLYNPSKNLLETIELNDALYNLMSQVIIGDSADNYSGVAGKGAAFAKKFITDVTRWEDIKELFQDEKDFYTTLNLAEIVGLNKYDIKKGEVRLCTKENF